MNNQESSCGPNEVETECEPAFSRNKDSPNQTNSENDFKTENEVVDLQLIEKEKIIY